MVRGLLIIAVLYGVVRTGVAGEAPDSASLRNRQKVVAELADRFVKSSRFSIVGGASPLVHHGPLLRWSNPTVGEVHGEIHLWTAEGRPTCLGSVYEWFTPQWGCTLELSSLVNQAITGQQGETEFWKPAASPILWKPFPTTETPAETAPARLTQMRRLARRFAARLEDTRQGTTTAEPKAVDRSLRLMPQPVFRYPEPSSTATYLDGSLFTFVEGTDPEVLILLEGVLSKDGPQWQYAVARVNSDAMRVSLDDAVIWSCELLTMDAIYAKPAAPYGLFAIDAKASRVKP